MIVTVATDSARTLRQRAPRSSWRRSIPSGFDSISAGEVFGQHLLGTRTMMCSN